MARMTKAQVQHFVKRLNDFGQRWISALEISEECKELSNKTGLSLEEKYRQIENGTAKLKPEYEVCGLGNRGYGYRSTDITSFFEFTNPNLTRYNVLKDEIARINKEVNKITSEFEDIVILSDEETVLSLIDSFKNRITKVRILTT